MSPSFRHHSALTSCWQRDDNAARAWSMLRIGVGALARVRKAQGLATVATTLGLILARWLPRSAESPRSGDRGYEEMR